MSVELLRSEYAPEPTVDDLAATANREHRLFEAGLETVLAHAIRAGEALMRVRERVPPGEWITWVAANFAGSLALAQRYIRFAAYQDHLRAVTGVAVAERTLRGLPPTFMDKGRGTYDEHLHALASHLVRVEKMSYNAAGRKIGISGGNVWRLVNPEQHRRSQQQRVAASKAARDLARSKAIKRAVKKAGAATAEAWAMAERMQDVLAQAQRETEDKQARAALSRAGEHYRKMRDEIVVALGVT